MKSIETQHGVVFDAEQKYRTFGGQISSRGHVTPQKGVRLQI